MYLTAVCDYLLLRLSYRKVNVVLMVSDGFGPTSETMARDYIQFLHTWHPDSELTQRWHFEGFQNKGGLLKGGGFGSLPLDSLLVGSSRTRSSNSLVTDSAAGATAFSCAKKTFNGVLPSFWLDFTS